MKALTLILLGTLLAIAGTILTSIICGFLFYIAYPHIFDLFPKLASTGIVGTRLSLFDCICIVFLLNWLISIFKSNSVEVK